MCGLAFWEGQILEPQNAVEDPLRINFEGTMGWKIL
jgi:hypothetical protein